jgi:thioredoxin-like negative regulator of GroEL
MSISSDLMNAPKEFLHLFKAGKDAARQGDKVKAHELFRQAIEVDPYHELVWLWLATVVDSDDDRRVCFENVLELNPASLSARRQLQKLEQKALAEVMHPDAHQRKNIPRWHKLFRLALMFLVAVAILTTAWWVFLA